MFLNTDEQELTEEYLRRGYIIRPVADQKALEWIRLKIFNLSKNNDTNDIPTDINYCLNNIHESITIGQLNDFRLKMIVGINAESGFREQYFNLARPYLDTLVGNELSMQLRINLSIQLPGDDSSLLPIHADVWSGDSPFEVVVWLPLVNCQESKSMFLLPPGPTRVLYERFSEYQGKSSEDIYQDIKEDLKWIRIKYGEVLVFNQNLPHGNRVNQEHETRWSMNCRFKSVFSPYGDKKLGEFFEPVTLRPASQIGMQYRYPGQKE